MNQAIALQTLVHALEGLCIRYLIGGSVASSSVGLPRATMDTDLLIQVVPLQVRGLARALGGEWYVDADYAREAVEQKRAFNVIHMASGYKFDLFPAVDLFHLSQLERAQIRNVVVPGGRVDCLVSTAEDTVLAKLRWYRDGGEISDRQWSDIMGVLLINHNLEFDYLRYWANQLGVADLLERALKMSIGPK